jgi:hypothetical protein
MCAPRLSAASLLTPVELHQNVDHRATRRTRCVAVAPYPHAGRFAGANSPDRRSQTRGYRVRRSLAFVVDPDGDEVEVRASLRATDDEWGGFLIGPADWIGIASSTEPSFELRL